MGMPTATIKKKYLSYANRKYFTSGAEDIVLGSYGRKRVSLSRPNYMEPFDEIRLRKASIERATKIDLNTKRSDKKELNVAAGKTGVVGGKGNLSRGLESKANLVLVKMTIDTKDLLRSLANDREAVEYLKKQGAKARICNEVFIVVSAEMAQTITHSVGVEVSGSNGAIDASVGGSSSGSRSDELKISRGTTLSYGLLRLKWDGRGRKKKLDVYDARADQYGMG